MYSQNDISFYIVVSLYFKKKYSFVLSFFKERLKMVKKASGTNFIRPSNEKVTNS